MLGSTFIHEPVADRLSAITVDDLDAFPTVDLDVLLTLDFESMLVDTGIGWTKGQPVQFDPDAGHVIVQVNPEGLRTVLGMKDELTADQQRDIEKLRIFVDEHGDEHIFELATF